MNLKDAIYVSCASYSSIFPNRAAVLNHLFCVLGNGFDWKDGVLVDVCEGIGRSGKPLSPRALIAKVFRDRRKRDEFNKKWEVKRRREEKKNPPPRDPKLDALIEKAIEESRRRREADPEKFEADLKALKKSMAQDRKKRREERKWDYRVPDDIKRRVEGTDFHHWYPISMDYPSNLANFPDDIKNDWLDGIIETAELICEDYGRFERGELPPFTDYGLHRDPDGSLAKKATRETYAVANFALHRANELKLERKRGK